jgi:branched-subunit amino acid ABC-type transport system permease component
MGIAHITLFLLALLLTTWGTSLILRALATKLASLRRTPPLSWMFRGNSIWDPKPESIGTPRASLTTLLGIAAALIGVACSFISFSS